MARLYLVTRADLPPGAQVAQTAHTLMEFVATHGEAARAWHAGANNLIVLSVPDERALQALLDRARGIAGARVACCHEPDLGGELTGVALGGEARRLVASLPLALRAPGGRHSSSRSASA